MDETSETAPVDEQEGAPVTDAASEEEHPQAEEQPEDQYEKRYNDLRSNHDRTQSLIARARQGDQEALRELTGFEFAGDEDEEPDPGDQEDSSEDPRVAAHDEWIQQEQARKAKDEFNAHLDELAGDPDLLDDYDRNALFQESLANGFHREATEAAFSRFKEQLKAREKKMQERYLKSKTAPHVPRGGTGATETVLPLNASHSERAAHMAERLALGEQQ